jgi:GT2 family glycosyltransferase
MISGPNTPRATVSIMITTRDRLLDLKRTCQVIQRLDPPPYEILITADGCTDGTVDFIRSELSQTSLIVNEQGRGSVASRDRMMREAQGDLVLSLDDDSYPEQADCLARIAKVFKKSPRLAVLHFPQRSDEFPESLSKADFGAPQLTRSFPNSGAVLKRSVYLNLFGFEPRFFHAYEEPDFALQCVAAGYEVCFNPAVTIRHHYSPQARSEIRTHHRHARNEFWSALIRCPFPYVTGLIFYRVFSQFRYACKRGVRWVVREPAWWWQALAGVPYCLRKRNPILWERYRQWLQLP